MAAHIVGIIVLVIDAESPGTAIPSRARNMQVAMVSSGFTTMSAVGGVTRKSDLSSACSPSAVGS